MLADGKIEIYEFKVRSASSLVGSTLRHVKFPRDTLVAAILRGDAVIVPSGEDKLQADDTLIIIVAARSREAMLKLFQ